jgi:serine/threonine-protein kinase
MFKGKLGYAAPEQIMGRAEQRSDVFAMGVLLWEVLAYRRLSQDRTQQEIVQGRVTGMDPELMRTAQDVPEGLLRICAKAAAKEPTDRYATAGEMRDALRQYMRDQKVEMSIEELRALLGSRYESERSEIRRLIDQRMKQAKLEDEHPSEVSRLGIPAAPALLGGPGTMTGTFGSGTGVAAVSRKATNGRWVALGALALGAVALAGSQLRSGTAPSAPAIAGAVASPAPLASTPSSTETKRLVRIKIAAAPEDAEIFLDGAKLDTNPFVGQFTEDAALHRLEVKSAGRRTEARMIRFDQDQDLRLALEPDPGALGNANSASPPAAAQRSSSAGAGKRNTGTEAPPVERSPESLTHRNKAENARPIDDADPYAP